MAKRKETPDVLAEILNGAAEGNGGSLPAKLVKPRPAAAERLAWEYAIVSFQDYKGWRPRYRNGRELSDWTSGPLMHEFLAEMAEEGWELAAASAGERMYGSADHHQLYFRRQK